MAEYDVQSFYDGLVSNGLIVPVAVQGAFGRGAVFEDVLERFNGLVTQLSKDDGAELYTFPPVIDRTIIEKTDYLDSFPNLAGTVFSFMGKEKEARALSEKVHAGQPWGDTQGMTQVCLNPAACYPVYPVMAGQGPLPEKGRLITMTNWVYRHEPSLEPTRMQSFRVREFVRAGDPDSVVAWRNMWLERGVELLTALGLPAKSDVAADPFFGRAGKMQEKHHILDENEIVDGIDELGVLLFGHDNNAYWYGSQLSIEETRRLAPYQNATGLQVTSAVLGGMVWALENPNEGIVEADEMDFDRLLEIQLPYLGPVKGYYTDWTPLTDRPGLFPEDLDSDDPWQFKNILVRWGV